MDEPEWQGPSKPEPPRPIVSLVEIASVNLASYELCDKVTKWFQRNFEASFEITVVDAMPGESRGFKYVRFLVSALFNCSLVIKMEDEECLIRSQEIDYALPKWSTRFRRTKHHGDCGESVIITDPVTNNRIFCRTLHNFSKKTWHCSELAPRLLVAVIKMHMTEPNIGTQTIPWPPIRR